MAKIIIPKKELIHLYSKKRLSVFKIADIFDCSAGTIINLMKYYKIKRRYSGPKRINITAESLNRLYSVKRLSADKIAKIYHCEKTAIINRLKKFNIPLINARKKISIDKNELYHLYIKEKLSTYKIAKKYKCDSSTILRALKINYIKIRPLKAVEIIKNDLYKYYFKEKLSLKKISEKYACNSVTILKKMEKFGFKCRTISETSTKFIKKNFNGNKNLKSYMIGFRLGDLRVRKSKNLIEVGCGTTKDAQINLIKTVFGVYGRINITEKDKNGAKHIDCAVNESFKFLLPKHENIPKWILSNKNAFLNFLAGYTDAEGNIMISNNMAKFRIRTYDKNILKDIGTKLERMGINNLFKLESMVHIRENSAPQNKDCWGITINNKFSLYKILSLLKPLLKHAKRKIDLENALLNVKNRLNK